MVLAFEIYGERNTKIGWLSGFDNALINIWLTFDMVNNNNVWSVYLKYENWNLSESLPEQLDRNDLIDQKRFDVNLDLLSTFEKKRT